jgi:hypothetical protein
VSRSRTRPALAAVAISAAAAVAALSGCSSMDAAVRATCSHVQNVTAYPLPKKHTVLNLMAGVRFNTTNATEANVAQLQQCVQRFRVVQGFTPGDSGDEGG